MGRLTDRYYDVTNKKWHWSIKSNSTNDGLVATPQDILDKLAHYEDLEEQGYKMVNIDKVVEQLEHYAKESHIIYIREEEECCRGWFEALEFAIEIVKKGGAV